MGFLQGRSCKENDGRGGTGCCHVDHCTKEKEHMTHVLLFQSESAVNEAGCLQR